jgi:hypothetical protein
MAAPDEVPSAIKIFLASMLTGLGGCIGTYKAIFFLAERFVPRAEPIMVIGIACLAAIGVGMGSAVTAGVVLGRRNLK